MWTDPGNIQIPQRHTNVEIGTEAGPFPEKEYITVIFVEVPTVGREGVLYNMTPDNGIMIMAHEHVVKWSAIHRIQ
jgi:hypothetical protein